MLVHAYVLDNFAASNMAAIPILYRLALIGLGILILQRLIRPNAAKIPSPPPLTDRQRDAT